MRLKKKVWGILLCFALVLGLMPRMSMTAYAGSEQPTVTISPEGAGTVAIETSTDNRWEYILTANPNEGYGLWYWTDAWSQISNLGGNRLGVNGGQSITCLFKETCTVTYKVVGGTWSDGTTADKTVTVLKDSELTGVPTGMVAATGYTGGSWDSDLSQEYIFIHQDTTFTYTFEPDPSQSTYKVTYKVVNGAWDEGDKADRTITLTGENVTLATENIPLVGTKPDAGYKEGSWDITPTAGTAITGDVTYTYTYVKDISGESSGDSSDSGNSPSGSTDSGSSSGSSSSSNTSSDTSSSSSSSSSSSTRTSTAAPATVPYDKVVISTGAVNDITGTAAATAEKNPFGTKIENNDNLTTLLALTPEEVAQGVNVWLDIQDMSATVPQAEKDIVQNASANYTVGMYLDINLFKKVGGNAATKITETNGTVKASILIPESLWKAGRTFEIIRVHDGVPTVITGTYDENTHVFTFETDKFSTYALAYNDSTNSTQSTAPRTGDNNHLGIWYLLLAVSLGGLGYLGYTKKKRVNK